jgi:P27 family predicted phage terminase small subunit
MGSRGPAPTPKRILELRGSWRANHRDGELELPVEKPSCPATLSPEARAEWRRVVAELYKAGAIAKVDRAVLVIYCEAWAEYVSLGERMVQLEAAKEPDSRALWHLSVRRHKAAERVTKLAKEFGLSPASRPRVRTAGVPNEEDDALEQFMAERQ